MLCDLCFSDAPGIESCHPNPVLADETSLNTAVKVTVKPNSCIMETGPLHSSPCLPISPLHLSLLPHPALPLLALSLFCLFHLSDLSFYPCLLCFPLLTGSALHAASARCLLPVPRPLSLFLSSCHLSVSHSLLLLSPFPPLSPSSSSLLPSFLCSRQPVEPIRPCKRGPFATVVWSV